MFLIHRVARTLLEIGFEPSIIFSYLFSLVSSSDFSLFLLFSNISRNALGMRRDVHTINVDTIPIERTVETNVIPNSFDTCLLNLRNHSLFISGYGDLFHDKYAPLT